MAFTQVPVEGTYTRRGGGPASGTVTFQLVRGTANASMTNAGTTVTAKTFTLNGSGEIPASSWVWATDDDQTRPLVGLSYRVTEVIDGITSVHTRMVFKHYGPIVLGGSDFEPLASNYALRLPIPAASTYLFTASPGSSSTSSSLTLGSLRVLPWVVTEPISIDRIGAEVTTIGETGSKFRIGIYRDTGACAPGSLLLDAGVINGDSATAQELTIDLDLDPGVYWVGGVCQVASSPLPTMRTVSTYQPPVPMFSLSVPTGTFAGYSMASVTGALPSTFTIDGAITTLPRTFVRRSA